MHCTSCGAKTPDGVAFCGSCGKPVVGYSIAQSQTPAYAGAAGGAAVAIPGSVGVAQAGAREYAGFWLRFVAYLIDGLLNFAVLGIIFALIIGFLGVGFFRAQFQEMGGPGVDRANPVFPAMLFITILTLSGFMIIVGWLYYAGMESSQYQGTFGKMALGLVVTDVDGRPITFARASGRFFAKIITGMVPLAIGYIMAGFTEKKQALHDMIASCLVLRKV
jgi:uncharacterized RDD family membrane protein YckC